MIKTKSLRIDYEGVTAVKDLDLEVLPGQVYGLVGPNGAGKTSTLKALAGIIEPTYGEIELGGFDLALEPRKALELLGFMPDFPPVYENLRVWEYLYVFAAAYLLPKQERIRRCREWVGQVNLSGKWDAYIHTLSRGMRQRLVLAKTLLHEPRIVLLDEPASGLDPIARVEMREILKSVAAQGRTIVISSHILTELSDFCNAIGVMEKGRMVASGSLEEIRRAVGIKGQLIITFGGLSDEHKSAALSYLHQHSMVSNISFASSGELSLNFSGNRFDMAALNRDLVLRNVPIAQIVMKEADMEDIFFKIGARETS